MAEGPTTAIYLSVIAGMLLVVGGIIEAIEANALTISFFIGSSTTTLPAQDLTTLGTVGIVFGVVMMASGYMLESHPEAHVPWGAKVLILSFLSIFTSLGGLVVGFLLGGIGGVKVIRWNFDADARIWKSYAEEVVRDLGAAPGESDRLFAIHDRSGLDGVVGYLMQKDPYLTSTEAIAVATWILAERDRLAPKANEEKLSNESTVQEGTNASRSERETDAAQEGKEKKSWIDKWLKR